MPFSQYLTNELHKQHLSLSSEAWEIIKSDILEFSGKSYKEGKSGFLNRIFLNCCKMELFPANISGKISEQREKYRILLSRQKKFKTDPKLLQDTINLLIDDYLEELKKGISSYPRGTGDKYRVNKEAFEYLCKIPEDSYEVKIFQRPGKYLKAIFSDNLNTCHYLVGVSRPLQEKTDAMNIEEQIASFRISRISKITVGQKGQMYDSGWKSELKGRIEKSGVSFLLCKDEKIKVRLTEEGVRKYTAQTHLRPRYESVEGDVYCFSVTKRQILAYFFKFGKDAEIIEPVDLRLEFQEAYREAAETYGQSES